MPSFDVSLGAAAGLRTLQIDRLMLEARREMERGNLELAGRTAERAMRLDPKRPEPWALLCSALDQLGSLDAEKAMTIAIAHFPEDDPFRTFIESRRSEVLARHAMMQESVDQARLAALRPNIPPEAHLALGGAFSKAGLYEEALFHAERAVEAMPDSIDSLYELGTVYRFLGRLDEAEALYHRVLACPPSATSSYAHSSLASLRKWTRERQHVDALRAALHGPPLRAGGASQLHYALFKELNDLGLYDQAWAELEVAAALAREQGPFDAADKAARVQATIEAFPKAKLAGAKAIHPTAPRPIFIIGLPRSGTTLVERILSAHSRVTAMGETSGVSRAVKTAASTPGLEVTDLATIRASANVDHVRVAGLYHAYTRYLSEGADVVTDKLPHNYEFVGQIRLAMPDASLVHLRRSPMDSLFGAYRLQFGEGAFKWSYSLPDLAANYRLYRQITDHWRDALGDDFIEVTLEALIADPETEIRRLLERTGLEFEEACLFPEKASGGVSTASATQIRSPINSQGVGAWRRYAKQLEPLRAELERDGFVDADGDAIWG